MSARPRAAVTGSSTTAPTNAWLVASSSGVRVNSGSGAPRARILGNGEARPLQLEAERRPRRREAEVTDDDRHRDAHLGELRDAGLEVVDPHREPLHASAGAAHEPVGRGAVDDRLPDLDRPVADPRHPAPPGDRRIGRRAVLQHAEPEQLAETVDRQVVVGDHRRRVEHRLHRVHGGEANGIDPGPLRPRRALATCVGEAGHYTVYDAGVVASLPRLHARGTVTMARGSRTKWGVSAA